VLPDAMAEAVDAPEVPPILQDNGTFKFVGARAVVILNERGAVVTTWARNAKGMVD